MCSDIRLSTPQLGSGVHAWIGRPLPLGFVIQGTFPPHRAPPLYRRLQVPPCCTGRRAWGVCSRPAVFLQTGRIPTTQRYGHEEGRRV